MADAVAECTTSSAVERVLDDTTLLSHILWSSEKQAAGSPPVIGFDGLCAAACVRKAWRDVVRNEDAVWLPLLRANAPKAVSPMDAPPACVSPYRAFMQLHRLGVARLPQSWYLQHYTLLVDVSTADGTALACAAVPLAGLAFNVELSARLETQTATMPDGGAAALRFLERVSRGIAHIRELRLQLLLRRADGAVSVLAREQQPRHCDAVDEHQPHYDTIAGEGLFEDDIWEAYENPRFRAGAVTWHSSHAPRTSSRLFGTKVDVQDERGPCGVLPGRWTWALQFPAEAGAVTQLSRIALRIGLRVKLPLEDPHSEHPIERWSNVPFSSRELAKMLVRRSADAEGAWVTL